MSRNSKTEPKDLYDLAYAAKDRESFLKFLEALEKAFKNNPESFENNQVDTCLNATYAWIIDKNKYQINNNEKIFNFENPDWKTIAFMFLAGKFYE